MKILLEWAEELAENPDNKLIETPPEEKTALSPIATVELPFYIAYAYSPREKNIANGHNHIVTRANIKLGRAKRRRGDAICAPPSRQFWGLSPIGGDVTCPKCKQLAEKHGLAYSESEGA